VWVLEDYSDPRSSWRLRGRSITLAAPPVSSVDQMVLDFFAPASRQLLWWRCYPMASMAARRSCSSSVARRSCTYNVRRAAWRSRRILQPAAGRRQQEYTQGVSPREVSFGGVYQVPRGKDIDGY
jgi:hypothetical protein